MNDTERRLFSMRLSFLRHLTEAMHVTFRNGGEVSEESIEKLNEVAKAVYSQHRKQSFTKS